MKTVMDFWCEFRHCQGGTIHDAKRKFARLSLTAQDKFTTILVDSLPSILDVEHAREFIQMWGKNSVEETRRNITRSKTL